MSARIAGIVLGASQNGMRVPQMLPHLVTLKVVTLITTDQGRAQDTDQVRILAKAFSGEFVPQNPDDEPARVLLERINAG